MGKIVAIGGGFSLSANRNIEIEILRITGKKPKLLFIPTAGHDSNKYIISGLRYLEDRFRLTMKDINVLLLRKNKFKKGLLRKKILGAGIIYVGGGNTLLMMNTWKRYGVDKLLIEAHRKGAVMCGSSAGGICWFRHGNSDSRKFTDPKAGLIRVSGLNMINALFCPHYDTEKDRKPDLKKMMKKMGGIAIACDEFCAIEIIDDKYKIISGKKSAKAYKIYWKSGIYHHEIIPQTKDYKDMKILLSR